jgi:hypothetical protein
VEWLPHPHPPLPAFLSMLWEIYFLPQLDLELYSDSSEQVSSQPPFVCSWKCNKRFAEV